MYIVKINNFISRLEFVFEDFGEAVKFSDMALEHSEDEVEICFVKKKNRTEEEL